MATHKVPDGAHVDMPVSSGVYQSEADIRGVERFVQRLPRMREARLQALNALWTPFRVYGDATCAVLYSQCDGRHVVAYVDKTYHRFLKCAVIGGIFSFVLPGAREVATACALSAAHLKGFDLLYKRITVGSDHGDGVVAVHSQRYPNLDAGGQFLVLDSDSHLGVTRSTKQTGPAMASALNTRLNVPIQ